MDESLRIGFLGWKARPCFGSFDYDGTRIFWKIDYYDRASLGTGRDMGSEEPSDPKQTLRVLTIMLASEY